MAPGCTVYISIETVGSGAHRPQKSPESFASPRPREPQRVPAWTFPRRLPKRPCQGVGANSVARPAAGPLQRVPPRSWIRPLLASSFTCLVAVSLRVIFPKQWGITPVSWLALSRACKSVPLDPLCKELPATSDFTFTQSSWASSGFPSLPQWRLLETANGTAPEICWGFASWPPCYSLLPRWRVFQPLTWSLRDFFCSLCSSFL